jgi:hypothetical protein
MSLFVGRFARRPLDISEISPIIAQHAIDGTAFAHRLSTTIAFALICAKPTQSAVFRRQAPVLA